jgi:hypothetical protein
MNVAEKLEHSAVRTNEQAAENLNEEFVKKKSVDEFAVFHDRVTDQSLKQTGPSRGSLPSAYTNRIGLHKQFQHPQAREIMVI